MRRRRRPRMLPLSSQPQPGRVIEDPGSRDGLWTNSTALPIWRAGAANSAQLQIFVAWWGQCPESSAERARIRSIACIGRLVSEDENGQRPAAAAD